MQKGFVILVTQRVLVHGTDNSGDAYDEYINHGRSEHSGIIEILKEDYEDVGPYESSDTKDNFDEVNGGDVDPAEYRGADYGED